MYLLEIAKKHNRLVAAEQKSMERAFSKIRRKYDAKRLQLMAGMNTEQTEKTLELARLLNKEKKQAQLEIPGVASDQ